MRKAFPFQAAVNWFKGCRHTPRAPVLWALTENPQFKFFIVLIGPAGVVFGYRFMVEHSGFVAYSVGVVAISLGVLETLLLLLYLSRPIRVPHNDRWGANREPGVRKRGARDGDSVNRQDHGPEK